MAYQVLARKWRPKKFADLVGQEHVVKALVNALEKGRLHHAYLLTGTRGVGKTTIARILAKSLNCPDAAAGEPCGVCSSCTQIDSGRYVDLLEIDAASNTGIDNIREVLENAQYAPTQGKYKVYIIDEVHMLSKSAFNAMLKTLEEPPEHVKFILATTDPHKVPVTVLSRCLQFVLRNLNALQVRDHLAHVLKTEEIGYQDTALNLLGRAAAGSMRDALSLLDQAIAMGSGNVTEADVRNMIGAVDHSYLYDLLRALASQNGQALMDKAAEMASRAVGFDNALGELALLLQQLSLLQVVPSAIPADDPDYAALQQLAQQFSSEQLQLYYQCAIRGKQDLTAAPDEYAGFVMTLLRMLAFAPMAAAAQPVDGQIIGSALHNPETTPAPKPETAAANVSKPVPPIEATPIAAVSLPNNDADLGETVSTIAATITAADTDLLPQANAPEAELKSASPLQNETQTDNAAADEDRLPERSNKFADEQPPKVSQPLPELTADNWSDILKIIAPKLGAAQMFSQHSAITAFQSENGELTLALAAQGNATFNKQNLNRLSTVLSEAYGREIRVQIQKREDNHPETPQMQQQRLDQEARQQALQLLQSDPTASALEKAFSGSWIPESLVLKQP
ncbi:DNA polymerase III subunit gamma/tau [Stenoxybacter acetivorans]|uniref:DNA polymerase III subunit gamma/tau n=1 Tax=Stenoxybacter acetivorans TaxID=422441 RepID=UPI0005682CCF|nr:DNA polymerase III subunit gamma/tau [Stenoxybacter acetivorans]